jgi:hypothetical protein
LLAYYTPAPDKIGFRSPILNDMQSRNIWEVGRFPAYFTDERCKELIMMNRNMIHYVSMQGGIWLMTHAGVKSLLCDFENMSNRSMALNFDELKDLV